MARLSISLMICAVLGQDAAFSVPNYRKDCWKKRSISLAVLSKKPGAGTDQDALEPFQTVYKDGFMLTGCVKDHSYEHGDKFGKNKHTYTAGDSTNTSIVHYDAHVPKADREPMSHEVCFRFCRTLPDMGFFGIHSGRDCYCTPFFDAMAGDSSPCDAVCEGNPTLMCGSMAKSSVFTMHNCDNTAEKLTTAAENAGDVVSASSDAGSTGEEVGQGMQAAAEHLQQVFGNAGDPVSADLMQLAKKSAGELEHAGTAARNASDALSALVTEAEEKNVEATSAGVTEAEGLMKQLRDATAKAEVEAEKSMKLNGLASRGANASNASRQEYYPIMYFVDRKHVGVPQTCGGDADQHPLYGMTPDECASACSGEVVKPGCVGWSYYDPNGFCFLFSKFTSVTYWTGCPNPSASFLQLKRRKSGNNLGNGLVGCFAKLAAFAETNISPDSPSAKKGNCKNCLNEATKADRCWDGGVATTQNM